jgi:O-acetyl-ADP-ribose deacetylase (regulator of RNase III)
MATARNRAKRPPRRPATRCANSPSWKKEKLRSIALPRLATGVGGLD